MKRLTIFTPTYNRAHILPKLYESLCVQTCKDFEWLIVDDGSTDNTREIVEHWIKEGKVVIRYFYQENRGKMHAQDFAARMTDAELMTCVDSDDELSRPSVVEDSLSFWEKNHSGDEAEKICGMISRKCDILEEGVNLGSSFIGTCSEICRIYPGDSAIFTVPAILRQYHYPEYDGENFIIDQYIYHQIECKYKYLYHPYCSQLIEYQNDGYSRNYRRILFSNPMGCREYHAQYIRLKNKNWIKSVICYISFSLFIRDHTLFSKSPNLLMTLLLYPLGCLKHLYDCYMLRKEKE